LFKTGQRVALEVSQVTPPCREGPVPGPTLANLPHLGQAIDPNVASLVLNTLDPASPVRCQPFFDAGA